LGMFLWHADWWRCDVIWFSPGMRRAKRGFALPLVVEATNYLR
jgi:hypothetical protein